MRYYPGTNQYKLVAMSKSNTEGYAVTYVRPIDPYYKEIIYQSNGSILASFGPSFIPCDPAATSCQLILQFKPEMAGYYWRITNGLAHNCSYSNSTGSPLVACTFLDTTGLPSSVTLNVYRINSSSIGSICSNSTSGATGTLICWLPEASGTYSWALSTTINPILILETGEITWGQVVTFGAFGLFIGGLFIMLLGLLGALFGSPALAIGFSTVGFIASCLLNLIVLSPASIIGVVVIAGVLIFLTRSIP
jgi:hypothetical protein